ncbi:MAG: IclR family transcriptional regulator [Pseudomonadota bacterium]
MNDKTEATKPVRVDSTLAKGLQVLEALARSKTGKGVTELSRELDLTKSNTFRLLQSLSVLGYVKSSASKLYAPTMKVWQIGQTIIGHLDLPTLAAAQMQALSKETGETIYLAVPDGLSVIYIDKIDSTKPIRSWNPVGGSAPLHCVGTGKALLAANYGDLREQIRGHLTKFTDRTITSIKRLDEDVDATKARGYAIDTGEYRERIYSFGAAIRLPNGDAIAALGVSVPDVNLEGSKQATICESVFRAANAVSEAMTGR